jgi:large subunit ribosomal protein L9
MKIVLRQDVPKLGEAGTVQEVKPGFARNYLIPQGMAVLATPGEVKTAEHNAGVKARKIAKQEAQLQSLADKIAGKRLEFTVRAGEGGRLYGSITASEVAEELAKVVGEEIDRRKVILEDPIRQLGEHSVTVHLVGRLRPAITVVAVGDAEYQAAAAEKAAAEKAARAERAAADAVETEAEETEAAEAEAAEADRATAEGWNEEGVAGAFGEIDNEGGAATLTEEVGKGVRVEEELDPVS